MTETVVTALLKELPDSEAFMASMRKKCSIHRQGYLHWYAVSFISCTDL